MPLLFTATTSAAEGRFAVNKAHSRTISSNGLSGADVINLEIEHSPGVFVSMGTSYQLNVANPVRIVNSEGSFKLIKGITTGTASGAVSG